MEKRKRSSVLSPKPERRGKADAKADIGLVNQYTRRELTPGEVFCFDLTLCDNEVDRDNERFTRSSLEKLAGLFVGKTGIFDHEWEAKGQIARLYRAQVEETGEKNTLGEPICVLRGSAYMLRTETNQPMIEAIEGGILKEISVGFSVKEVKCSVCGERMGWDGCPNGHKKGEEYEGKLCVGLLTEPLDAYEFSFVAVPAQRGAGVTKSFEDVEAAVETILAADLSERKDLVKVLSDYCKSMQMSVEERKRREELFQENKNFLKERIDEE